MYSIKKKAASLVVAGAILFGGAFTGGNLNPVNLLSFKPLSVCAATDTTVVTDEFKIGEITYKPCNAGVSVTGCGAITSAIIPSEVTNGGITYEVLEISGTAFKNNSIVSYIQIPDHVYYINLDTFTGCSNLSSIGVSMYNQNFFSYDGVLYNKNFSELKKYPPKKIFSSFTVPSSVYCIDMHAFDNCVNLESVYLSGNITYVSEGTFNGCSKLKLINVDTANQNLSSINGVLYSKDKKELIKYPGGLTNTTFTIIKEVEKVYDAAFADAIYLNAFYVATGNYKFSTFEGVLFDFYFDSLISYPIAKTSTIYNVPSIVTNISDYAFKNTKVTDIRNLNKRIALRDCNSNFVINSSITSINGSSTITTANRSFIFANIDKLELTSIVINAVKNKVEEAKNYLHANYPNPTEFQKAKGMHDWLCKNVEYLPKAETAYGGQFIPSKSVQDSYKYGYFIQAGVTYNSTFNTYYVDDLTSMKYHCASGALLLPITVCDGYAQAYKLLMLSVSNKSVSDKSIAATCEVLQNSTHVWNAVKIGDFYYAVDCCHDDREDLEAGYEVDHFLKTNDYLKEICNLHESYDIKNSDALNNIIKNVLGDDLNNPTLADLNFAIYNYVW